MIFSLLKEIFDWAEVWAILIPLLALRKTIVGRSTLRPIILYLYLAFALNVAIMLIWKQGKLGLSLGIKNNNPIYNLLSILRFYLFSWYFISLRQPFLSTIKKNPANSVFCLFMLELRFANAIQVSFSREFL